MGGERQRVGCLRLLLGAEAGLDGEIAEGCDQTRYALSSLAAFEGLRLGRRCLGLSRSPDFMLET